jgi:ankyrin repeat protein
VLNIEELTENDNCLQGGWTSLMWSCYKGRVEVAQLLMEKNADVHAQGNYHISCLLWAAGRGHPEILHHLLEHGAKAVTADKVQQICMLPKFQNKWHLCLKRYWFK